MKTVNLTIGERTKAVEFLNNGKFSNSTLATVLDDLKKFVITAEEWEKAELKKTPTDAEIAAMSAEERQDAKQVWNWKDDIVLTDIELERGTVDVLLSLIKEKSDANGLTLADGAILTLEKKLKAE